MAKFVTLTRQCGKNEPPGTLEIGYLTYISELADFPRTLAAIKLATTPTPLVPAVGDTKILGEAFDFTGAPSGTGYWRTFPILINTGQVMNVEEGEIGGKTMMNDASFFIPGNDAITKEAVECLRSGSGCCVIMIPDKNKRYQVVGNPDAPCYFDIAEPSGTGGERVGYAIRAYADTGAIYPEYDATLGIDITPNA